MSDEERRGRETEGPPTSYFTASLPVLSILRAPLLRPPRLRPEPNTTAPPEPREEVEQKHDKAERGPQGHTALDDRRRSTEVRVGRVVETVTVVTGPPSEAPRPDAAGRDERRRRPGSAPGDLRGPRPPRRRRKRPRGPSGPPGAAGRVPARPVRQLRPLGPRPRVSVSPRRGLGREAVHVVHALGLAVPLARQDPGPARDMPPTRPA